MSKDESQTGLASKVGSSILSEAATLVNTTSGSRVKRCLACSKALRDTKETISNGLKIIRIRYGLPYSELPILEPHELSRFLSFLLLQGKERPSVAFPRCQKRANAEGLFKLQRLCRRERWELAHSVSSIKRNLPAGCRHHSPPVRSSWEKNAFSNPPPPSLEYLSFLRKEVSRLFPYGWDRHYEEFVYSHVPNASARLNHPRADLQWAGRSKEFIRKCIRGPGVVGPVFARYKEVLSAGKLRPLLIFDESVELLGPLHKTIYSYLKSKDWCLVGPPDERRVSSVCEQKFQTSVDLVNATDNLSLSVTEAILGVLFRKSTLIPGSLKLLAFDSLHPLVNASDGTFHEVTHGQMMGGYLSFPLLCLHSYLAARWATRGMSAKILVNGDDTLISAPVPIGHELYPPGYMLNDLKTIRAENVAEINSTAFLCTRGKWRVVRHLRRGGFLTNYSGMLHASAAVRYSTVWTDAFIHSRIGKSWGFLPSQLGLSPRSYPAFSRARTLGRRYHTDLPSLFGEITPGLSGIVGRLPDPDEILATRFHLFQFGRGGGRKRDLFEPSIGSIRRGYGYTRSVRVKLTYRSQLRGLKWTSNRKGLEITGFVPCDYISRRDDRYSTELAELRRNYDATLVVE